MSTELVSKAEFARRLSVTPARVSQLLKQGLPVTEDGRIPAREAMAWVRRSILPQNGAVPTSGESDLGDAKLRLTLAQARMAELAADEKAGSLIDRNEAQRGAAAFARVFRDGVLNFAARQGPALAHELGVEPRALIPALDAALRTMLVDLSKQPMPIKPEGHS